jgi:hypothetical protein
LACCDPHRVSAPWGWRVSIEDAAGHTLERAHHVTFRLLSKLDYTRPTSTTPRDDDAARTVSASY